MGIDVELRNERGEVIGRVADSAAVLSRGAQRGFTGTRLLKYVVPWGDAIFNQAQAGDLADDIREVLGNQAGTPLGKMLGDVQVLVERLAREGHLYLWFVGD